MRVILLGVALVLISASFVAFLLGVSPPGNVRIQRSMVTGQVRGDLPGQPWTGTVVTLGREQTILAADGAFSFAMMPGRYNLSVCCSEHFQAINREVIVEKSDIALDLAVNPLKEIKGRLEIRGGTQIPYGYILSARLDGTNVVDRVTTATDGTFTFHLLEGDWEIQMDNLPSKYKIVSMTLGEEKVRDRRFTLARGGPSLALRIALQ
jgi:hypothetical protein